VLKIYLYNQKKENIMFEIKITTVSPLCQIDEGGDVIKIKRMPVIVNVDGNASKTLRTPVYTANGFRGMLRRVGYEIILEALFKKGYDHKVIGGPTNFHLHNAGGGNNFQGQSIAVEKKVRELSPLISVFGASLAVEGKLIVDNFIPKREIGNDEYDYCYGVVKDGEKEGSLYSNIYGVETIVKGDDLLSHKGNARFMTEAEIYAWELFASENKELRAQNTDKSDKERVKKETIKHIQGKEFIIPGVDLYGAIDAKMPLTDLEKGMMIRILEKGSKRRLASSANAGHGKVEYNINFMDGCSLTATIKQPYGLIVKTDLQLNEEGARCVKAFDDWLENITEENVQLDKVLI
jgi:CRISPR type IV-associated protein Csf2